MRDKDLYAQILGIKSPWQVSRQLPLTSLPAHGDMTDDVVKPSWFPPLPAMESEAKAGRPQ